MWQVTSEATNVAIQGAPVLGRAVSQCRRLEHLASGGVCLPHQPDMVAGATEEILAVLGAQQHAERLRGTSLTFGALRLHVIHAEPRARSVAYGSNFVASLSRAA